MQPPAGAGCRFREIGGPQDARVAADIRDKLALIPDVIAGRQDIDAAIVEFAAEALGQSETARGVLGVDYDEVNSEISPQLRQIFFDGVAARAAHHVAAKQNFHRLPLLQKGWRRNGR